MAYDEFLADRIRQQLSEMRVPFKEKEMMGGLVFMVDDKMCVGIIKNELMARIDPAIYTDVIQKSGCREMDFTGRSMKGFIMVSPEGIDLDDSLAYYIDLALDFNPRAKSSRKR